MTSLTGKKLGILISSHPDKGDLEPVRRMAGAARIPFCLTP